jgi:hypothetical protein
MELHTGWMIWGYEVGLPACWMLDSGRICIPFSFTENSYLALQHNDDTEHK